MGRLNFDVKSIVSMLVMFGLVVGGFLLSRGWLEERTSMTQSPMTGPNLYVGLPNGTPGPPVPPVEYPVPYQDNDGRWGYKDGQGVVVVQPQFSLAHKYSEGLALVGLGADRFAYIDPSGRQIIGPFQAAYALSFSDGWAARGDRTTGEYIDGTGKVVLTVNCEVNHNFHGGIARIGLAGNRWGYIDTSGKWIIPAQFKYLDEFSEDLACAVMEDKAGFINKTGKWIIEPQFDDAKSFIYGLAPVAIGDKWGYIQKSGEWAVKPQYDIAHYFGPDGKAEVLLGKDWYHIDPTGQILDKFLTIN